MKTTTKIGLLAQGAIAAALMAAPAHAQTIDTTPYWDGSTTIAAWGGGATNTYGEVFDAPASMLNSFTFYVNNGGRAANYVAQVYNWTGSNTAGSPVGAAIWSSAASVMPGVSGLQAVTIDTGGVSLITGQRYDILLYDNSGDGVGASWGLVQPYYSHPGVAGDVGFAFNNGPSNVNGTFSDFGSLAYTANFSAGAVPEPATWAMMVLGFGMVGFGLRARRKPSVRVTYA